MAGFDYVIIGSGAGGGPLAANLARAGFTVCLIDAGGDFCADDEAGRLMYEVPIFHGLCTEFQGCKWDYFVEHFANAVLQHSDTKYDKEGGGIWYPRAGALGGCTTHNAMITVTPQAMDWDHIAQLTGDWSWRAEKMYQYFARLENCHYVPRPGSVAYVLKGLLWSAIGLLRNRPDWKDWSHGHGFEGWLATAEADPRIVLKDQVIVKALLNTVRVVLEGRIGSLFTRLITRFDPNDLRNSEDSPEGLAFTPLAVCNGKRNGPRDYILSTHKQYSTKLTIKLHSLVTKILFEDKRAIGVEFIEHPHLYKADPASAKQPNWKALKVQTIRVGREVILAAGAFNSPQLLKLSGIGPAEELRKHNIEVVVDLPGVGENLQDRYEIGVVSDYSSQFALLQGALFRPAKEGETDPFFDSWKMGKGLYTSNGSLIGIMKRSSPEIPEPDLYMFALPGFFKGYFWGFSTEFEHFRNRFTWVILKAYTNNRAGSVTLRSNDPTMTPHVIFRSFKEGTDELGDDMEALVKGIHFVRGMNHRLGQEIEKEIWPGQDCDTDDKMRQFIEREAWGHHASCSNKIGAKGDPLAVLDSRFRVRGTEGLRVVDASVFPKIPGYFIVSAVYMIAEKAFDVIKEDAEKSGH